ncbi:MAG: hypothetical protein R3F02_19610 [Thiolinea sp.]
MESPPVAVTSNGASPKVLLAGVAASKAIFIVGFCVHGDVFATSDATSSRRYRPDLAVRHDKARRQQGNGKRKRYTISVVLLPSTTLNPGRAGGGYTERRIAKGFAGWSCRVKRYSLAGFCRSGNIQNNIIK